VELYSIQVQPDHTVIRGDRRKSILDMAALQRVNIPVGCKGGGCGICKIRIVSGEVEHGVYSKSVLSDEEKRQGYVLSCQARPMSDLIIERVHWTAPRVYGR
jgi:ferredoxin